MQLKNKNALITGGSEGIGFATAERFLAEGAHVAIVGRSQEKLKNAQEKLGSKVKTYSADVANSEDLKRVCKNYEKDIGKLDVLVASAGLSKQTFLDSFSETEYNDLVNANIKGIVLSVFHCKSILADGASVILLSSIAAKMGAKDFSVYCATKAAVISLTKCFAADFANRNIRVNSISPGVVQTPMLSGLNLSPEVQEHWKNSIPLKRFADPSEIANVALFLASSQSSYITATDITVDGGASGISSF